MVDVLGNSYDVKKHAPVISDQVFCLQKSIIRPSDQRWRPFLNILNGIF